MNDYERMARVIRHLDESFHQQPSLKGLCVTLEAAQALLQEILT